MIAVRRCAHKYAVLTAGLAKINIFVGNKLEKNSEIFWLLCLSDNKSNKQKKKYKVLQMMRQIK